MEHRRSRGGFRPAKPEPIELGNEPPLSVDGGDAGPIDRRRVSVQWFAGTILTALCGAALMGGAVFTSLDGETTFAAVPEHIEVALRGALSTASDKIGARKSDRLPNAEEPNYARHVIRVSTISRAGNHEVVRVRPLVRVAGNLALAASDLSANIPPFNPQRMLADSGADGANPEPAQPEPDAEVAFVMRDLAPMLPKLKIALVTPNDEVMARVREAAEWSDKTARHIAVTADNVTGIKLAYAGQGTPDPYAGFEARVVPENVTLLAKTAPQTTGGNPFSEKVIAVKKGDTLAGLLKELGASDDDIAAIAQVLSRGRDGELHEGQKLRVLLSPVPGTKDVQPVRVIVAGDSGIDAVAALSDMGKYVPVDVRNVDTEVAAATDEQQADDNDDGSGIRLYQSIYETALRDRVPKPMIEDLIRIYSYDVDFQRKVQPGDSFEVLYAGEDEQPAADTHNEVLFTALTVGGETKKFYRFQSPDDGLVDFYDEHGKSAKKFLVRKPVAEGIMRSGFGIRRHPILGYTKMHTGVDWAAPTGTPIYAAGNGVIEKEGWESGYGKFIMLRHANGYETAYGHMSAYAKGTHDGEHVRQGQVIGFVGSTGLSTGSHVHFEIRINGRFVDPMRIKLPRGRELQGPILAQFEKERERIDGIMARKPSRVASNAPVGR